MSDLPGTPKADVDPAALQAKLEELSTQVSKLMEMGRFERDDIRAVPANTPKCFIIMPFGKQDLEELYREFIAPTLQECKVDCTRGDDIFGSNVVMEDVREGIQSADLIVADLTGQNPNVFYEVGIAHTLDKRVLLLSSSIEDVPFDLRHRRILLYEYTPMGCKRLVAKLREFVLDIFGRR